MSAEEATTGTQGTITPIAPIAPKLSPTAITRASNVHQFASHGTANQWAFHLHWVALLAIAVALVLRLLLLKRFSNRIWPSDPHDSSFETIAIWGAAFAAIAATATPLADLARHTSLLAHMAQLALVAIICPVLTLVSVPRSLFTYLTRPAHVDVIVRWVSRPLVAACVFNIAIVAWLTVPVVEAQSRSGVFYGIGLALLFLAGMLMWIPPLRYLPGTRQLTLGGRVGYLFLQSVLPNFPALVFIFARRPLYPVFGSRSHLIGISALADQQLAGVVAKAIGILLFWGLAIAILLRAEKAQDSGSDPDPLRWDDVERELERLDRTNRKARPD